MTPLIVFKIIAQAILSNFSEKEKAEREENSLYLPSLTTEDDFMEEEDFTDEFDKMLLEQQ